MIVYILASSLTNGGTFIEMIYSAIQVPLQGLTGSLYGAIGIAFFISFLWWFGVHGQSVVNGVVTALLLSNLDANKAMLASGNLSLENGAHIVTQQFFRFIFNSIWFRNYVWTCSCDAFCIKI